MCLCAGQLGNCELAVKEEVLAHAKSVDDSMRVHPMWTPWCLAAKAKYQEQVSTSLEVLKQLGEVLPLNPGSFQMRRVLERTKHKLKTTSNEEILALPIMEDDCKVATMGRR